MACTVRGKMLLKEWQKRLGLQEWCIKLSDNCDPEDITLAKEG